MTDKPVPSITALMRLSHEEFAALLFADAKPSGGQGPPPNPTSERQGRDEPSAITGGQGPLSLDDHAAAHDASMDGRQGRPDIGGQSDAATGSSPSESIADSRQGRLESDDPAGAATGDPRPDSDAGARQGRAEGSPADQAAEPAAGQGPAEADGSGDVDVQDEGSDGMETVGGGEEPTAPVSADAAVAPEAKTPAAVVVVDASFAALVGPDVVPSGVRGAARRLWREQVVAPTLSADAPDVDDTVTVPSVPSADAIPDDRPGRSTDDASSVDGQGPETLAAVEPAERQGRPSDGDHPPAGPAEASDPAAGPPAADEMGPAGPAEGGQESGDPTAPVDGAAAEPKAEMDPKSARQLRLLREAADEVAEDHARAAREAEAIVAQRSAANAHDKGCVDTATWLTTTPAQDPDTYARMFRSYAAWADMAISPVMEADLAIIIAPPSVPDGQIDADIAAAQQAVDDTERELTAALDEVEAAMAAEEGQRTERATDEKILVDIGAAEREAMVAALAVAGRSIPTALLIPGPITDEAAAAIRPDLLVAEQTILRRIAEIDAADDAADPRVLDAITEVRSLVDAVWSASEARIAALDAILVRDGWKPIGTWLLEEAERIAAEAGFPTPDPLSLSEAEAAPERHAGDPRPGKPMWHKRATRRTRRFSAHPMQQRVNEHLRAEEIKP